MIKNIVFDIGNVIIKGYAEDVLDKFKIDSKTKNILLTNFFSNTKDLDLGKKTILEKYNELNINLTDDIKNKIIHYYKYRDFNTNILNIIMKLKENNYHIYILSDNNIETYEYLSKLPSLKIVDGWIISGLYHTIKKDKKLFSILFETFNLNPEDCFFIDDKKINVDIGISLGMEGHVFNPQDNINVLIDALKNKNKNINI